MHPVLRQVVLDTTDVRRLAEFYRVLLGWDYRPGDGPPADRDWLVLVSSEQRIAFQQVPSLPTATWPEGPVPQQLQPLRVYADPAGHPFCVFVVPEA